MKIVLHTDHKDLKMLSAHNPGKCSVTEYLNCSTRLVDCSKAILKK